jgi:hypothetical protein
MVEMKDYEAGRLAHDALEQGNAAKARTGQGRNYAGWDPKKAAAMQLFRRRSALAGKGSGFSNCTPEPSRLARLSSFH